MIRTMNKKALLKKDSENKFSGPFKNKIFEGLGEKSPYMNKKGGEKLLSIWWFFVLIVIAGGIFIAVLIYYSVDINVNAVESDVLAERILNCINENGNLDVNIFNPSFDIFQKCNLNPNLFGKPSYYFISISVYDGDILIFNMTKGDYSFEKDCLIQEKVTANYFPKCSRKIDYISYNNRSLKMIILAGSNQKGKNG